MLAKTGSQLSHSTLLPSKRRTKPVLKADYIVGLTDGEGCFYVNVRDSASYHAGASVELQFHIKLNARDRELLEVVKESLGCGGVYFQKETRANHAQCFRYTVNSHQTIIEKIIPFFKKYPLQSSSKLKSFQYFCEIAEMVEQKLHHSPEGIEKIRELKSMMNKRTGLA
ncbi:MAG: LAGLIDADG family homing endonuclease [bacterium]|nr:LAGLIDADG family homing endonuclease [bacterium]